MKFRGERRKVGVVGADDDSGVSGVLAVEADEVLPIVREDGTVVFCGKAQDFIIRDAGVGFAGVVSGQDIMPEPTQRFDHGQGESSRWNRGGPS
jgi:hypothetical protein